MGNGLNLLWEWIVSPWRWRCLREPQGLLTVSGSLIYGSSALILPSGLTTNAEATADNAISVKVDFKNIILSENSRLFTCRMELF